MFLFLFGLPGTGKNYIGRFLDTNFGYSFFDGDDAIPIEMMDALKQGLVPSRPLEDRYYQAMYTGGRFI